MRDIDNKLIISSDIFDTLVYRLVAKPEDIFKKVAQKYEEKYNKKLEYDYVYLRKLAEKKARSCEKSKEIHFENIFNFLPYDQNTKEILKKLEFEIEKRYLVLNDEIYQFLLKCKEKGMLIILVSDMYFSNDQIKELLKHIGCDVSVFDNIFMSCDFKASKANKRLYRIVKNTYPNILPNEFLHIGDNYYSDFVAAKNEGMEAIHYTTFLESLDSVFALEEAWGGETVPELRNLRKKARCTKKTYTHRQRSLFNIGSQIFGPVYSLYVDWIIDYALENNIKVICPLMREGKLFEQMLLNAVKEKDNDLQVKPLYVSRKATYLPSLEKFDSDVKENLLGKKTLNLKDLFNLLLIPIESTIFKDYKDNNLEEIYNIKIKKNNLFQLLEKYLEEENVISLINENILSQKRYFRNYIIDNVEKNTFITVDLGGQGSIQTHIDKIMNHQVNIHHLMMIGRVKTLKKIIDGHNFSTWLGYDDLKNHKINTFFRSPEIIESITNIAEAGTSHYSIDKNKIKPVKTNVVYPNEAKEEQSIVWKGIYYFQKEWRKLDTQNNIKKVLFDKKDEFLNIFYRLINYPLYEEAVLLGELLQDDQFSYSRMESIITEKDISLLDKIGIEKFLSLIHEGYSRSQVYWPQGVVALENPNYFLQKFFREKQLDHDYVKIYSLINQIVNNNYKKICVYGAGEIGKKILTIAKTYNLSIDSFIDRNFDKMIGFEGIPVNNIDYLDENIDLIIIGSQAFYDEIKDSIIKYYNNKKTPEIVGLR